MNIAIVGSGVSGLVAAYFLHEHGHDVTVYEAAEHIGGHVLTVPLIEAEPERQTPVGVDMGFIVFNERNYPGLTALLQRLDVASRPSEMSFSVKDEQTGLEWAGKQHRMLRGLFAQPRNLVSPRFLGMLRDVARFNRKAPRWLADPASDRAMSLGEFLDVHRFGKTFRDQYLVPMGAAIWSAAPRDMLDFPVAHFLYFFQNHGLLQVRGRPRWRTVAGGSARYVEAIVRPFADRFRLNTPVIGVTRNAAGVTLELPGHETARHDHVVIAAHGDTALEMLRDASDVERQVLAAFRFQENDAVLHGDTSLMPRSRNAWAAWNYLRPREAGQRVAVTYNMNILQGLPAERPLMVTLNHDGAIDPATVIRRETFQHPIYDAEAFAAQERWADINGQRRTWFAGAYWGYGFHEDGLRSALDVLAGLGIRDPLNIGHEPRAVAPRRSGEVRT